MRKGLSWQGVSIAMVVPNTDLPFLYPPPTQADLVEVSARLINYDEATEKKEATLQSAIEEQDRMHVSSTKFERRMYDAEDERDRSVAAASELRKEVMGLKAQLQRAQSATNRHDQLTAAAAAEGDRLRKAAIANKKEAAEGMEQLQAAWDELADASAKRLGLQTELGDVSHRLVNSEEATRRWQESECEVVEKLNVAERALEQSQDKVIELESELEGLHDQLARHR
jgi:chromosome segregation ATPase